MRSKSVEIKGVRSSAAHQRALYTQNLIDKSLVKIRFFLLYSYISVKINTLLKAISEAIAFIVFIATSTSRTNKQSWNSDRSVSSICNSKSLLLPITITWSTAAESYHVHWAAWLGNSVHRSPLISDALVLTVKIKLQCRSDQQQRWQPLTPALLVCNEGHIVNYNYPIKNTTNDTFDPHGILMLRTKEMTSLIQFMVPLEVHKHSYIICNHKKEYPACENNQLVHST